MSAPSPSRSGRDCYAPVPVESRCERWEAVTRHSRHQHGLVATHQFLHAGFSLDAIQRAVDDGIVHLYRYGVYEMNGAPESGWQPLMAACLAAAPFAAASFRSAALLYRSPAIAPPPMPEITLFGGRAPRLKGVIAHRSVRLHTDDQAVMLGIPCTSPARTIVDLGRYVSKYVHARTLDDAIRRGLCGLDDVGACLERIGGRGRPGTRWLRILLAHRRGGWKPGDSDFELEVRRELMSTGVSEPVQQHQVVAGGHVYVLDLAWPAVKVGVDVNGPDHVSPDAQKHDAERRNRLTRSGWQIFEAAPGTSLPELARLVQDAILTTQARMNRDVNEEG